jgi:hypothetical protein
VSDTFKHCYHSVQNPVFLSAVKNVKVRLYKTIILLVVLYGCESWFLTFTEEHKLRVFDNRVRRKIFPGDKAARVWSWPLTSNYCWCWEYVDLCILSHTSSWPSVKSVGHRDNVGACGSTVVEVLCYKPEGHGFETPDYNWILWIYLILLGTLGPLTEMSTRKYCWVERGRCVRPITSLPSVLTDSFHPEDGGNTFLRNVGSYNSHTVSHTSTWHSS